MAAVPALSAASQWAAGADAGTDAKADAGALASPGGPQASSARLQAAVFTCDITPPLGSPLVECNPPVAASADIPLLAKGVVISDGSARYVLCALDYCELRTGAHDLFRRAIANALAVNELRIEVHCIHQHDAPFMTPRLNSLWKWSHRHPTQRIWRLLRSRLSAWLQPHARL